MLMGNFVVERAGIVALCRVHGINTIHAEDGFFPHYATAHGDPLGFCWESSLPRMIFRGCSERQRQRAQEVRQKWLQFSPQILPDSVIKPFVFWPLQLIGDKVNQWDLNVKEWAGLLRHFRGCVPEHVQMVIKEHPRSKLQDNLGVEALARELPNTVIVPKSTHLKTLLKECSAAAGANSSVLYEARLMFRKPTYVYARSWFTNHSELFIPVAGAGRKPRLVNRFDFVENNQLMRNERLDDYTDWFLAQLLARQISHEEAQRNPKALRAMVDRLSYHSFVKYGEEIFA